MDPSILNKIIFILSSAAANVSIPVIAIMILTALQRKIEIRGFKFFITGFFSQIISTIIGVFMGIIPWLAYSAVIPLELWAAAYAIHAAASIFLMALSYFFLTLGFLSLLGYKVQVNGLAIASAILAAISLFVPWFTVSDKLIAPTYTFPMGSSDPIEQWLLPIIVALITIAIYCHVIGSTISGRIGRILILVGGIIAFVSPFTYFLVFNSTAPWVGLALPLVSTLIAYFAIQHHPKEMERALPDLTGLKM